MMLSNCKVKKLRKCYGKMISFMNLKAAAGAKKFGRLWTEDGKCGILPPGNEKQ